MLFFILCSNGDFSQSAVNLICPENPFLLFTCFPLKVNTPAKTQIPFGLSTIIPEAALLQDLMSPFFHIKQRLQLSQIESDVDHVQWC